MLSQYFDGRNVCGAAPARAALVATLILGGACRLLSPVARAQSTSTNVLLSLPASGDHALRVLTPNVVELELVQTKAPDPAPLPTWTFVGANFQLSALGVSEFSVLANSTALPVQSVGFKRRVAYAPLKMRDLRVASFLYLQLANPIADGQALSVSNPSGLLLAANVPFAANADPLRTNPALHVNQVGYTPGFPKKAMVGYYLGSLGELDIPTDAGFKLVDASGAEVFKGSLVARPDRGWTYSPAPYQKVYEADFSAFETPGVYRLVVPGMGASLPFRIDDGTFMNFARTYALGLYHQRCGMANAMPFTRFTHDACHTAPATVPTPANDYAFTWKTIASYANTLNSNNPPQTAPALTSESAQLFPFVNKGPFDVSGGHHDAGDYSKYTTNSAALVHTLVFAVDSLDGVAGLDNLGLPESGDGVPDLLQEAKWEADFLAKLQDADGGFYFLVYPRNREYESDVLPDHGDPQVVWPKNTAASAAATAALAQAGSSPAMKKYFPDAAANYLAKAKLGWQFLVAATTKYGKTGAYQKLTHYGDNFADDDEIAWAAAEMFLATGDPTIHDTLRNWFDPANPKTWRWGWWHMNESYGNAIRSYAFGARSGRIDASKLDPDYLTKCEAQIAAAGDDALKWSQMSAYGTSFSDQTKAARGGGWYFSLDQAFDLAVALQLGVPPLSGLKQKYTEAYVANLNYEGGNNPVNMPYVTGLGQQRQHEIVDQYAQNDRRVLPPSGIPISNLQTGQPYLDNYKSELGAMSFPDDGANSAPYPYYDRWSDTYNVSTEFIAVNQARSLAGLAYFAAQTSLRSQAWRPTAASINNSSGTAQLTVPSGLDAALATVVWEASGGQVATGASFTVPAGVTWLEAEAQWPDGRRVFAATDNAGPSSSPPPSSGPAVIGVSAQGGATAATTANPAVLVFTRTGDLSAPLTVNFTLSGSATKWNDYRTPQGDMPQSVTFPAGADTTTLTVVPAPGNTSALLGTKSFTLSLAAGSSYSAGTANSVTLVLGTASNTQPPSSPPPVTTPPPSSPPPPPSVTVTPPPVTVTPPPTTPPTTTAPPPPTTPPPPAAESQIVNFSARANVGSGAQALAVGFIVSGTSKPLLIRSVGPSLSEFGIARPLAAPALKIFRDARMVAHGELSANALDATAAAARLGAFKLPANNLDASLLTTVGSGAYVAQVSSADDASGVSLVEIYDADTTASSSLSNVSALAQITVGESSPLLGFIIAGNTLKQLLIRGLGPALAQFGLTGLAGSPQVRLFSGQTVIADNANWNRSADAEKISAAAAHAGAFPLRTDSTDAALLVSLQPGAYTVQLLDANNTPGLALVEIYDVR